MENCIELRNVIRRFGDTIVLRGLTVDIACGELVAFVGPSGAGKTTLLRLLAGLDRPDEGEIRRRVPVSRSHPAILVFQDYVLFPHMNVFDNVAFGLRSAPRAVRLSRRAVASRVRDHLARLGIGDKERRFPAQLSGGERQRVALARALVMSPELLLLDEPFANLDRERKGETARFIADLQREFGVTTVIVSHDLDEAGDIADRVGVIVDGTIRQIDAFEHVYFHPSDGDVARMFGPVNELSRANGERRFARPESIRLVTDESGAGRIVDAVRRGGALHYRVRSAEGDLLVRADTDRLQIGDRVAIVTRDEFTLPEEVQR